MDCRKLFEVIDGLSGEYLDILEDVCNIESPTSCKEGVDAVGSYFVKMAEKRAWKIEVLKQELAGDVICITLNPDSEGKPISVSGHIDTVHPIGSFGNPAVRRDEKNMYGPGVMDCKGGVVAAFLALDALEKCGFERRPVKLLLQTDEETSSRTSNKATIEYICKEAENSVAFLNLEGYKNGTAVLIRKGILKYCFTVRGKAGHASRCFDASSAIAEAAHKILQLEEMKDPYGITCNCGIISGGTVINTVPELCTFGVDVRFSNDEELKLARERIIAIAEDTKISGCSCEVQELSCRPAMPYAEMNNELLEKMNDIYEKNGLPVLKARSCLSGSDAAYTTMYGIPTVDCIGTEGGNIHSTDEYMYLTSLAESAKRIASVIYCI